MTKYSTPHQLLRLAASGLVWLCAASFALAQTTGFVFTADEAANSVSRIDLSTGKVDTVPLPLSPHNVDISGPGRPLLVVGPGVMAEHGEEEHSAGMEGHGEAGLLAVLDPIDLSQPPRALISVGEHPAHVVALKDGSVAFVTNAGEDTVGVVDLAAGKMIERMPTGKYPHGMRLSPDEQFLLVANVEDASVSLIDVATRAETARIPVGRAPVQVGFLPDGLRAFVSLRDEDAVAVIDLTSREVTARIPVGRGPIQLHATPDGRHVVVANQGSDAVPDNRVSVVDVATGSVVARLCCTNRLLIGLPLSPDRFILRPL